MSMMSAVQIAKTDPFVALLRTVTADLALVDGDGRVCDPRRHSSYSSAWDADEAFGRLLH